MIGDTPSTLSQADFAYPDSPSELPRGLTQPAAAYRRRAWIALLGLLMFFALYIALAGWFAWMGWRLMSVALAGDGSGLITVLISLGAFCLSAFMLRALFFLRIMESAEGYEITPESQPRFFEFLHRLADEVGSRRPRRVRVTANVNAAVSYDISLWNLLFPSRRNLEVGLGLINVLTMLEFKAVLAHEFGHFSQSTMLFGRWVYLSSQVAGYLVAKRDKFDAALERLSRIIWLNPLGLLWLAVIWSIRICVWSIREVTDVSFRLFLAAQRALSREMEFQADLVAVSVCGSDPLVHALHTLQGAEAALRSATSFATAERDRGLRVPDLFELQDVGLAQLRQALAMPDFGQAPALPDSGRETHRLFKSHWVRSPTMWATHPSCADREENCKRRYVPSHDPGNSAWCLFDTADDLRATVTAQTLKYDSPATLTRDQATAGYAATFARPALDRKYQGAYLRSFIARGAVEPAELYAPDLEAGTVLEALATLYPPSLSRDLEQQNELTAERDFLQSVLRGTTPLSNGTLVHRGVPLSRSAVPATLETVEAELMAVSTRISEHDRHCRAAHYAAADMVGEGWQAYVKALLTVVHYAEHSLAAVTLAQEGLSAAIAAKSKAGRIQKSDLTPIIDAAGRLYSALSEAFGLRSQIYLDAALSGRFGVDRWPFATLKFDLISPSDTNIADWLNVIGGWIGACRQAFAQLRQAALDQLLETEALIADAATTHRILATAPIPSRVPTSFTRIMPTANASGTSRVRWTDRVRASFTRAGRFIAAAGLITGMSLISLRAGTFVDPRTQFANGLHAQQAGNFITAAQWYRKAAAQGDAGAQNNLGLLYSNGTGVPQDHAAAMKLFQAAADNNDVHALGNLAQAYLSGEGVPKDEAKGLSYVRRAAALGATGAQRQLGLMLLQGHGTAVDAAQAVPWLQKAADKGDATAQEALGYAYATGQGVAKDLDRGFGLYLKSANQGSSSAAFRVGAAYFYGNGVARDYTQAVRWLTPAEAKGNAGAQALLGLAYSQGLGLEKDPAKGTALFLKAAAQGDVNGEFRAGHAYLYGAGVAKDPIQAIGWLQKAAAQGSTDAEVQLGIAYLNGWGVDKDSATAIDWLSKAAKRDNLFAYNELGRIYAQGMGVQRDPNQAIVWFRKGAERGEPAAETNLAAYYARGEGTPADLRTARSWLQKAVDQHFEPARTMLAHLPKE